MANKDAAFGLKPSRMMGGGAYTGGQSRYRIASNQSGAIFQGDLVKQLTGGTVSPSYISPIQGLQRLQRIMDEYVGGIATNYMTNENMLKRGLELLAWLEEDLEKVGAEDYHQLMRAWELKHRALTSQCVTEHTLFREETRWPGYYYRGDHMKLDDDNWHCLTVSRRDPKTGKFSMEKVPVYHIVDENEKKKAS